MTKEWKIALTFTFLFVIILHKFIFNYLSEINIFETFLVILIIFSLFGFFLLQRIIYFLKNFKEFLYDFLALFISNIILSILYLWNTLEIVNLRILKIINFYSNESLILVEINLCIWDTHYFWIVFTSLLLIRFFLILIQIPWHEKQ